MKKGYDGKVRAGVIGVGYLGRHHAIKYFQLPNVELVGVVDIDRDRADKIARECSTRAFYHYSQLFDLVDAVSIVAPTKLHFEIAREFLKRGIDVLLEKPITSTLGEAEELIRISEIKGSILQVGHLERFNPAVIALQSTIDRPMFIESHRLSPFKERGTDVDVILDLMIHDIDIILNLVKADVRSVEAVGVPVISPNVDISNARLTFTSGCVANVTSSRISAKDTRKIRIFQPNAYISIDYAHQRIIISQRVKDERGIPAVVSRDIAIQKTDVLFEEIKAFLYSIQTRKEPLVKGIDGKRALEVALKVQEEVLVWREKVKEF